MSHFYLTLPSNSSEKYYPDNTLTHFVTKLHNDVDLSGDWEVALVDIMYPRNWYTINDQYCRITYKNGTKCYDINVPIPSGYYRDVPELVGAMKAAIDTEFVKPQTKWTAASLQDFVANQRQPNTELRIDEALWPKINYNSHCQKVILTLQPEMTMKISDQLSKILAIESTKKFHSTEKNLKSTIRCDIDGGLHAMYVYSDVLECVPVGDTMAPLLRIVEIKGQKGEMVHIQYDQPRYVPLRKKHFDSIEIDIRDDLGQNIPFDSGKLIVTLHFRKQRESYYTG